MKNLTRSEAASFLSGHDHYAILTHRNPDGDTLGCAAALCRGLRQMGKTAHVLQNPGVTDRYRFLMEGLTKAAPEDTDTLICVDTAAPGMVPDLWQKYLPRIVLRIDHHGTATPFTEYSLVEPETAACGEIIYGILMEMGGKLEEKMADAIYTAVSTDTGRFCFANTTADTLRIAADCVDAGCRQFQLNQDLFETHSLGRLRLQGYLAENARFLRDGEMALCTIPLSLKEEMGLQEDDLENISGFPRTIAGVKLAATLREHPGSEIKVSVRAVPGYDAAELCARFGGGGHKGAAGATLRMPLEEAAKQMESAMLEMEFTWTES